MPRRCELITDADIAVAREYLTRVLTVPTIANSLASKDIIEAAIESYGSLRQGAHLKTAEGLDALRAQNLEDLALELKRRRNPSRSVNRVITNAFTTRLARLSDRGVRETTLSNFEKAKFGHVADIEAEKIVAPLSARLRKLGF